MAYGWRMASLIGRLIASVAGRRGAREQPRLASLLGRNLSEFSPSFAVSPGKVDFFPSGNGKPPFVPTFLRNTSRFFPRAMEQGSARDCHASAENGPREQENGSREQENGHSQQENGLSQQEEAMPAHRSPPRTSQEAPYDDGSREPTCKRRKTLEKKTKKPGSLFSIHGYPLSRWPSPPPPHPPRRSLLPPLPPAPRLEDDANLMRILSIMVPEPPVVYRVPASARRVSTCSYQGAQGYYDMLTKGHPVEIREVGTAGRGLFATEDIKAGETILAETPAVAHPTINSLSKACYLCLGPSKGPEGAEPGERATPPRRGDPYKHSTCPWPLEFCSRDCQRIAEREFYKMEREFNWAELHQYCKELGLKFPLAVRRFVCMVLSGSASPNGLSSLCFKAAEAGMPREIPRWAQEQHSIISRALQSPLVPGSVPPEKLTFFTPLWYTNLVGRFQLNAFKLQPLSHLAAAACQLEQAVREAVLGEGSLGTGVYLLPSFCNHSCDPNVDVSWPQDATVFLQARRDIQKGEELTITYIDASLGVRARRATLKEAYGFDCACPRCQDGD